jgi:hypothetical protein
MDERDDEGEIAWSELCALAAQIEARLVDLTRRVDHLEEIAGARHGQ